MEQREQDTDRMKQLKHCNICLWMRSVSKQMCFSFHQILSWASTSLCIAVAFFLPVRLSVCCLLFLAQYINLFTLSPLPLLLTYCLIFDYFGSTATRRYDFRFLRCCFILCKPLYSVPMWSKVCDTCDTNTYVEKQQWTHTYPFI